MPVKATQRTTPITDSIIPFDASLATNLPTGGKKSQKYVVTVGGNVAGVNFIERDVFYALIDNPQTVYDFGDIEISVPETEIDTDFELVFFTALL